MHDAGHVGFGELDAPGQLELVAHVGRTREGGKFEARNPKAEGRPKSETQSHVSWDLRAMWTCNLPWPWPAADLSLRPSDFGLLSDFGLRPSDFITRMAPPPPSSPAARRNTPSPALRPFLPPR